MQTFNQYPFYNCISTGEMFDFPMVQVYESTYFNYNDINQYQSPSAKDQDFKSQQKTNPGILLKQQESEEYKLKQFFNDVKKSKVKNIQKQIDDDYKPYKKNKKKGKVSKQKEDRNLIPNSVNHLLAYVQKRFKSGDKVQKIFSRFKHPQRCNINRYYAYHKMLRFKINNYVNSQAIRIVTEVGYMQENEFNIQEQLFYCKISRILIKYFLKNQTILDILLSKKIKKKNVYEHLKVQRTLYQKMKEQLSE